MSIDRVIQVKNLLFLRTILVEEDEDLGKIILANRARAFAYNPVAGRANEYSSPISVLLNTSAQVDLFEICMRMIVNGCYYSKREWKEIVWKKVWSKEDDDCALMYKQPHQKYLLFEITDKPYYLVW